MNYYKLINGETFVGIASQLDFREYQKKHNILLACKEETAQYVQCEDALYHANWMKSVITDRFPYTTVELVSIDEEEYNMLREAIEAGKDIIVEPDNPVDDDPLPTDPIEEVTVEYVKNAKISEMNNTCNKVITNGFDTVLSDGESHHFSLTTQDQLNLITLSSLVENGETAIPYHADGELCKFYSAEDIGTIITMATSFKTYHVSYFNALRAYIESLDTIENIRAVTYGTPIPEEYQSEVLKVLNAQIGASDEENT